MPSQTFQLKTITRILPDDVELAEAIGLPEVSAVDDAERKWRVTLQTKAGAVLADPTLAPAVSLHCRQAPAEIELDSVEITFDPPRRSADWQQPVTVTIHYARWLEEDLHHAFVPVLGIRVFAARIDLLPDRVREHVRLVLSARRKRVTLEALARLGRVQGLRVGNHSVTVNRKSLRQAIADEETEEKPPSALAALAEELPPLVHSDVEGGPAGPKPAAGKTPAPIPAAYELETELAALAAALGGPHRRSILLVGPPGCGKTALVREFARRRREFSFGHTPIWSTTAARLMTGPIGFGMWQERCQEMCREVSKKQSILHLGNLAELLEVGKTSRTEQSVGGFLRPWIARGEVLVIAECHPDQLGVIERNDPHLLGAFQQMPMPERTVEQTLRVLERAQADAPGKPSPGSVETSAALHRLQRLHTRYATYSANPGRPLRFLKNLMADRFPEKDLTETQVIQGFSRETGLPRMLLDDDLPLDLEATRGWFAERVIGQLEAVAHVLDLLATIKAGLGRPRKPLASFLFIGPTGTGKTEMAKALAEFLFGDVSRLVRFDLNEFSDPVSVQRLIGGPAAGQAEGLLTARVREQPFSVILLDEFEKADPGFFDLLLQVLGDGRLTDSAGRVADFCNSVIVMTSNLGAQGFQRGPSGFRTEGPDAREAGAHFAEAVRKFLRPEIYNRLDAIVPFRGLTREIVLAIARRQLERVLQRDGLRLRGVECEIRPEVAGWLVERGYDARYGARPLKRAIEHELIVPLAEALNQYVAETPLQADVAVVERQLQVTVRARIAPETRDKTFHEPPPAGALSPGFGGEGGPAAAAGPGEGEYAPVQGSNASMGAGKSSHATAASAELIQSVTQLRRRIMRLGRCPVVGKLEDDVTLLESLQRRAASARWKQPELQARLDRLPELRACLEAIASLAGQACDLETDSLTTLYRREALERGRVIPQISRITQERQQLVRRVFRLHQESPDDILLAFFGEPRELTLEFARIYGQMAMRIGRLEALDYFLPPPGGRSDAKGLLRETAKKPDQFFVKPPEKVVGVVLQLQGDLFRPRFAAETGLHVVRERKEERVCLIQEIAGPREAYAPPPGIDRSGAIRATGASVRRTYHFSESWLEDDRLGKRVWLGLSLEQCLDQLIDERMVRAMEAMTQ